MRAVQPDDELILRFEAGSQITATKDLVMDYTQERAFTAGVTYTVTSMNPITAPAFIVVKDDQLEDHRLEAADLREYFTW